MGGGYCPMTPGPPQWGGHYDPKKVVTQLGCAEISVSGGHQEDFYPLIVVSAETRGYFYNFHDLTSKYPIFFGACGGLDKKYLFSSVSEPTLQVPICIVGYFVIVSVGNKNCLQKPKVLLSSLFWRFCNGINALCSS